MKTLEDAEKVFRAMGKDMAADFLYGEPYGDGFAIWAQNAAWETANSLVEEICFDPKTSDALALIRSERGCAGEIDYIAGLIHDGMHKELEDYEPGDRE